MLTANVLCFKKKKKRTYCLSNPSNCKGYGAGTSKNERSRGTAVTMMHITEDTPPDMLAGAMDLSVHLPNGKTVKMSVERSTPMMDLLVQITTAHHLQLSNHTLQVLGMAPSSEHNDKVLPFKPNTPIGTLDTQHIRVLPKGRTLPAPKYAAPGHQPFESTFRLKVHLPRNQLYVTRVSRNVLLEDIMKKVCEEKNLDPIKYDFKHPGNLDEVLDPKLTLSDYQITEIYVVAKGTTNPSQAFSAADIMVLRKEEERKQMHNKTGGGVFNLIFKRGKSSMGSGSISSDNRSISPTHSDDSRSVTPPAVQAPPIVGPPKKDPPPDRPKPPQRKRRPAPKPPQIQVAEAALNGGTENTSSVVSSETASNATVQKGGENGGLTICHSRNSSDSSGYHEASILSDHCANASLPRSRPKSAFVGDLAPPQSTSNLSKMAQHSKSTTSLIAGRKKKAAPPPPPATVSPANSVVAQSDHPSPLVASQSDIATPPEFPEVLETSPTNPAPVPRPRHKIPKALPRPESNGDIYASVDKTRNNENALDASNNRLEIVEVRKLTQKDLVVVEEIVAIKSITGEESVAYSASSDTSSSHARLEFHLDRTNSDATSSTNVTPHDDYSMEDILTSLEAVKPFIMNSETPALTASEPKIVELDETIAEDSKPPEIVGVIPKTPKQDKKFASNKDSFGKRRGFKFSNNSMERAYDPETASVRSTESKSSMNSVASALNAFDDVMSDLDEDMFTGSLSKGAAKKRPEVFNQLFGIHDYDPEAVRPPLRRDVSATSLCSTRSSIPGLRKWDNSEDLDSFSVSSFGGVRNRWVAGDASDTESVTSVQTPHDHTTTPPFPLEAAGSTARQQHEEKSLDSTDSGIAQDAHSDRGKEDVEEEDFGFGTPPPPPILNDITVETIVKPDDGDDVVVKPITIEVPLPPSTESPPSTELKKSIEEAVPPPPVTAPPPSLPSIVLATASKPETELVDIDWQYQLPSPPKAFRDSSPSNLTANDTNSASDFKDSVVTSPELFEKLRTLEDNQSEKETLRSEATSVASEEPLNTLSLEHLEKRKSLVYNRELATSLKMTDSIETSGKTTETFASSLSGFQTAYNQLENKLKQPPKPARTVVASSHHHTLPNFQITTYDVPKHKNIKVFEDDTIRSNTHGSASGLTRKEFGSSMENVSFTKKSTDTDGREYKFYKPNPVQTAGTLSSVSRSGSFSTDNRLTISSKPVSRSKSTLTLNKYHAGKREDGDLSRSSSLFDVSGLQSLEVMRLIQNKLNSPPESTEDINVPDQAPGHHFASPPQALPKPEEPVYVPEPPTPAPETARVPSPEPVKKYYYRGPPAVNMSTWSERAKIPVAVKEDEDYTLGNVNNRVSSKLIVNTTNNNVTSNNSVEVRSNGHVKPQVSVNVNGTEQITQKSGNVVIKIGSGYNQNVDSQRFMGPVAYRKPLGNVNGTSQRPHSIAFASDFDLSRVPVVRSVELKKPFKEPHHGNTSITHLNQGNDLHHHYYDKSDSFAEKFRSTENLRNLEKQESSEPVKRVFRVGSFKPAENPNHPVPIVRGFKSPNNNNDISKRLSWAPPATNYNTLPAKVKVDKDFVPNRHVPFSQSTLRRTGSNKLYAPDQNANIPPEEHSFNSLPPNIANRAQPIPPPPPPAPQVPKTALRKAPEPSKSHNNNSAADPRDTLLESIRNFGGKRGLKAVKA